MACLVVLWLMNAERARKHARARSRCRCDDEENVLGGEIRRRGLLDLAGHRDHGFETRGDIGGRREVERKQDDIAVDRGRKADATGPVIAGRELKYRGTPLRSHQLAVDQETGRSAERAVADETEAA